MCWLIFLYYSKLEWFPLYLRRLYISPFPHRHQGFALVFVRSPENSSGVINALISYYTWFLCQESEGKKKNNNSELQSWNNRCNNSFFFVLFFSFLVLADIQTHLVSLNQFGVFPCAKKGCWKKTAHNVSTHKRRKWRIHKKTGIEIKSCVFLQMRSNS